MESTEGTRARRAVPSRATDRRAGGGAVGPRGRSVHGQSCSGAFTGTVNLACPAGLRWLTEMGNRVE
jgi:hypothetical protein